MATALLLTACGPDAELVEVALWHCGIEPLHYQGRIWEVPPPSFDATNAPAVWRGKGTVEVVGDRRLVYTDRSGIELTFVPGDGVKPGGCA